MHIKRLLLLSGILFLISPVYAAQQSCGVCHGDPAKMAELGYPHFTMIVSEVEAQTKMSADCTDCHMGNSASIDKDRAHEGILTVRAVRDRTWEAVVRGTMKSPELSFWRALEPRGESRADALMPKLSYDGVLRNNPDFKLIMWHDRNDETLAFNPLLAEKTCGKCHEDIVKNYLRSPMGGGKNAHTQSQYKTWTGAGGPQSCGLWTGKLAEPQQASFTTENVILFNQHSTLNLSDKTGFENQRRCNQCHVGCLDCHYSPQRTDAKYPYKGQHTFIKKPGPVTCYGGGKSFSCHAGPLERRRGDGFIRAEFTQATDEGKKILKDIPDIHMQKGIYCVDCHEPNKKSGIHADLQRQADCAKCHAKVVTVYNKGPHRKVDCASCHTSLIGGYAFNFWSAIGPKGKENPLTRIQDYLVGAVTPLIVKNPKGTWIPVHIVPHTSGNINADEVVLSTKLIFRNSPDVHIDRLYFSNDAFAITGLVKNLDDKDHDTMVWLNADRVAHSTGKSRSCGSCHDTTTQNIETPYSEGSYKDVGEGKYAIVADEKSLRVVFPTGTEANPLPEGLVQLKDKWTLSGNFAMPKIRDRKGYEKLKQMYLNETFVH